MKNLLTLTAATAAATLLTACGATTGGSQATSSAIAVPTATAQDTSNMTCAELFAEMSATDALIAQANNTVAGSNGTNVAGQVAVAGASQVALQNGGAAVLGKVPFGGLFAKAAMDSVANAGKKKAEQAQLDIQNANLRKAQLNGLYAGKGCAS